MWGEGNWVSRKAPESLFPLPFLKQLLHTLDRRILSIPSTEGFKVAQRVRNLPAMQETRVHSLGQEDALEKGMAIYSSILA